MPSNSLTPKHQARRLELLTRLAEIALKHHHSAISLRQFAIQIGVSEPTLRHFFTDRQGVVIALIEYFADGAADWLARSAEASDTLDQAVEGYTALAIEGSTRTVFARAHAFAFVEAIHDPVIARTYLDHIIEPSLKAIEQRLQPSIDPQNSDPERVRHAAFFLYAPVLTAILHQRLLNGEHTRPLNLQSFFTHLTTLFKTGIKPEIKPGQTL